MNFKKLLIHCQDSVTKEMSALQCTVHKRMELFSADNKQVSPLAVFEGCELGPEFLIHRSLLTTIGVSNEELPVNRHITDIGFRFKLFNYRLLLVQENILPRYN